MVDYAEEGSRRGRGWSRRGVSLFSEESKGLVCAEDMLIGYSRFAEGEREGGMAVNNNQLQPQR